jgi:hypothetical protein
MTDIDSYDFDLFLISEPNLSNTGAASVARSRDFFCLDHTSRAAVYIKSNTISFTPISRFCTRDLMIGLVESTQRKPFILASIYLDGSLKKDVVPEELENAIDYCRRSQLTFIGGGDLNAHSLLWSENENPRGKLVEEFIIHHGLQVHNTGREPTWRSAVNDSIVDVTLTWPHQRISDRRDLKRPTKSDHRCIAFSLGGRNQNKVPKGRNYFKADWTSFKSSFGQEVETWEDWSCALIEERLSSVYGRIESALDKSCPRRDTRIRTSQLWWRQECEDKRRHCKATEKKAFKKGKPTQAKYDAFREAQRELNQER